MAAMSVSHPVNLQSDTCISWHHCAASHPVNLPLHSPEAGDISATGAADDRQQAPGKRKATPLLQP